MAKLRHKAKTTRSGSKKPAAKAAKAKSKRAAPRTSRKRVVARQTSVIPREAPAAMIAPAPVAESRELRAFPMFWPALAMMRMWLGPRAAQRTR